MDSERRKYKRFLTPVTKYKSKGENSVEGTSPVHDISREGFRIDSSHSLSKDAVLGLEISFSNDKSISCTGAVCWSRPINDGKAHATGLKFLEIHPDDKMLLLEYAYDNWTEKDGAE